MDAAREQTPAKSGSAADAEGAPPAVNLARLLDGMSRALAQRHAFLDTPPGGELEIVHGDTDLMAWAIIADHYPGAAAQSLLAQWLRDGSPGERENSDVPSSETAPSALEELLEPGISALAEMARTGSLETRLAGALVLDEGETLPPLGGGASNWTEFAANLNPLDASVPVSGVLAPVAASLPATFGGGSLRDEASVTLSFDTDLARDDAYTALAGSLAADFDVNEDGFTYADDSFRGTAQPAYADGARIGAGGYSGGALRVILGGVDDADILGMSGGWDYQLVLVETSDVSVTFRYQLTHSSEHEADEYAEVLMSVDGVLYGSGANDYVARLTGDGNGGPDQTTGWQVFTVDLGELTAGTYSVIIGGHSNKKTFNDEWTEVLIDEVTITDSGPLSVGSAQGVLANDIAANGLPLTAALLSGPSNGTVSLAGDGSFVYTPDTDFLGIDSFTYSVADGVATDSGRVVIEVGNVVQGSAAAEVLTGTAARDAVLGLGGDDTLTGGEGDDRLTGGPGADNLTGGIGADIFAYDGGDGGAILALADIITDFDDGTDLIGLSGDLAGLSVGGGDLTVTDNGGDAVITVVSTSEILAVVTGGFGAIDGNDFVDV